MTSSALEVPRPQDRVIRRPGKQRDWAKWGLAGYFTVFLVFLYGPMIVMAILSLQGYFGGVTFPFKGPLSLIWLSRSNSAAYWLLRSCNVDSTTGTLSRQVLGP